LKCVDFAAADARKVGVANRSEWWLLGPDAVAACR